MINETKDYKLVQPLNTALFVIGGALMFGGLAYHALYHHAPHNRLAGCDVFPLMMYGSGLTTAAGLQYFASDLMATLEKPKRKFLEMWGNFRNISEN